MFFLVSASLHPPFSAEAGPGNWAIRLCHRKLVFLVGSLFVQPTPPSEPGTIWETWLLMLWHRTV